MVDLILILVTIFFLLIAMYQADKNKNKSKKSIPYKLSKMIANILNFITFLDTQEANNIIDDIKMKIIILKSDYEMNPKIQHMDVGVFLC